MYSRTGYIALKVESAENTAVKPDVFFQLMSEDMTTEWGAVAATPIAANRVNFLRPVKTAIAPPSGTLNILADSKRVGSFLKAIFGAITTGRYFAISSVVGTFTVGETITGGTSAATATVVALSSENDYLLVTVVSGTFTVAGENITGGSSGATAAVGANATTVYGHQFTAPQASLPTYTLEIGYDSEAYRFTGVRFNSLAPVAQADNIVTLGVGVIARSAFNHARVTAALSSGSGSKTITLDQTTGLAASDTIKVFRPSTGAFLDFSASSVKTHTVGTVASETSITVTDLQTSLAVGDLLMLAPQTPSYTQGNEFFWIGGSSAIVGADIDTVVASGTVDSIEDFSLTLVNELEPRHAANGANVVNRFPAKNLLKGLTGEGKLTRAYTDQAYFDMLRNSTAKALLVRHTGGQIGSTNVNYKLEWRVPNLILRPFASNLAQDDIVNQEMEFDMYYSSTDAYLLKALIVNDVSTYA